MEDANETGDLWTDYSGWIACQKFIGTPLNQISDSRASSCAECRLVENRSRETPIGASKPKSMIGLRLPAKYEEFASDPGVVRHSQSVTSQRPAVDPFKKTIAICWSGRASKAVFSSQSFSEWFAILREEHTGWISFLQVRMLARKNIQGCILFAIIL